MTTYFFRSGFYLGLILIMILYFWKNNKKNMIMYIPLLGNLATWVLLLYYQTYRYVWFMQIIAIMSILLIVSSKEKE